MRGMSWLAWMMIAGWDCAERTEVRHVPPIIVRPHALSREKTGDRSRTPWIAQWQLAAMNFGQTPRHLLQFSNRLSNSVIVANGTSDGPGHAGFRGMRDADVALTDICHIDRHRMDNAERAGFGRDATLHGHFSLRGYRGLVENRPFYRLLSRRGQ